MSCPRVATNLVTGNGLGGVLEMDSLYFNDHRSCENSVCTASVLLVSGNLAPILPVRGPHHTCIVVGIFIFEYSVKIVPCSRQEESLKA